MKIEYEMLYRDLLIQFKKRVPRNSKLVSRLVDILSLEKEAVYRRLRQEVPFTFEEIVAITKEFNISLDNMLGVDTRTTLPFRFHWTETGSPIEIDYLILEKYVQAMEDVASDSEGEISIVTNLLPQLFYTGFQFIYHFYYFLWRYYSIPVDRIKSYHEIILPDRLIQIVKDIFVISKNVKTCYFVLNNRIFQDFVNDVAYFKSIRLIKDEDVLLIKDELFHLLNYMETIAAKGFADDPSNEIFIYISETNVDTSYFYVDSQSSFRVALIWSFIFTGMLIFDEKMLDMMKRQIRSKIKTSTLLSVAGEKQRIMYFEAQRKIVEQL